MLVVLILKMTFPYIVAEPRSADILRRTREESDGQIKSSYSTVTNGCAQKGNYWRGSVVLRIVCEDFTKGNKDVKPDLYCYNSLVLKHIKEAGRRTHGPVRLLYLGLWSSLLSVGGCFPSLRASHKLNFFITTKTRIAIYGAPPVV